LRNQADDEGGLDGAAESQRGENRYTGKRINGDVNARDGGGK
jgi:hypothetical protein